MTIFQQAELIELKINESLTLFNQEFVYLLAEGELIVYYSIFKNEDVDGPRNYLFSIKPDQIVFEIRPAKINKNLNLILVAAEECKIYKISSTNFYKALTTNYESGFEKYIEQWVKNCKLFDETISFPFDYTNIESFNEFECNQNTTIYCESLKWIKQNIGQSIVCSNNDLLFGNSESWFPVDNQLWLTTTEISKFYIASTKYLIEKAEIQGAINYFNELYYKYITLKFDQNQQFEHEQLELKSINQELLISNSINNFQTVIDKNALSYSSVFHIHDELFSACSIIGEASGITFKAPAKYADNDVHERLKMIVFTSQIQKRKVELDKNWWTLDIPPLLVFDKETNKPFAVIPYKTGKNFLIDPVNKTKIKITASIAETLKLEAYSFFRPLPNKKLTLNDIVIYSFHKCSKDIWRILFVGTCYGLAGLIVPVLTGKIFEDVIPNADKNMLAFIIMTLIVSSGVSMIFLYVRSIAAQRIQIRISSSLQIAIWDRILQLPVSFFRQFSSGELAMRANAVNSIMQILSNTVLNTLLTGIFSIYLIFLLMYYDYDLVFPWIVLMLLLLLIITVIAGYFQTKQQSKIVSLMQKISGLTLQFINGVSKIRISGTEANAFAKWADLYTKQRKFEFKNRRIGNYFSVFNVFFSILSTLVILIAIYNRLDVTITGVGVFIAFLTAYSSLTSSVLSIGQSLTSVLQIIPSYKNLKPIFENVSEVDDTKSFVSLLNGNIEFNDVSFRYQKDGDLILKKVNMKIPSGKFVAIVGTSGAGKSTLVRLLLGFEQPESGSIYYDGKDIKTLEIQSLRRQIGTVLQNGKLMPGSIFSNIAGINNLSLEDAWDAAKMVGIDDDIRKMPMQMYTVVSEGGSTFSGGQKQRLLIARAIVNKPKILIFDEATSALDNQTQMQVSNSLDTLKITRIIIAHRLSTIKNADYIYVLHAGSIIEQGTFNELFDKNGIFTELVKRQME